jgi:hypothetical protein
LAASAEQMSKMSRGLLEFMDRFALDEAASARQNTAAEEKTQNGRRAAAAASRF